jgi:hypothetical protein
MEVKRQGIYKNQGKHPKKHIQKIWQTADNAATEKYVHPVN